MVRFESAHAVADVASNVARVRERIAEASRRSGRRPHDTVLVVVTKGVAPARIRDAVACGITDLGESRVQEALPKVRALTGSGLRWHLVGHLQRNKVRQALGAFSVVHSVDSERLAMELDRHAPQRRGEQAPLDILLQVNVAGEPQKFGVAPGGADALARAIAGCTHLRLIGLMTIAPQMENPELARPVFRRLRELQEQLNAARITPKPLAHLSMGMSDDFEVAIEEGATIVRIGRAIFGPK